MRDVAYGTKQYKAAPLEVIQYTEINKCIKTKMLLLKKRKNESLGCTSSIQGWFSLRTESELYSEVQTDAIQWNRARTVNFWAGARAKDERISFGIHDRGMGGGVKVPAPPSARSMWKSNWNEIGRKIWMPLTIRWKLDCQSRSRNAALGGTDNWHCDWWVLPLLLASWTI